MVQKLGVFLGTFHYGAAYTIFLLSWKNTEIYLYNFATYFEKYCAHKDFSKLRKFCFDRRLMSVVVHYCERIEVVDILLHDLLYKLQYE